MPNCSVRICKNRNENVSYKKDGITFHRFPKDGKYKEKWIEATQMSENWFPTKNSTICSQHFEETCFRPSDKRRLLFADAVPTLKLKAWLVYETVSTENTLDPVKSDMPCKRTRMDMEIIQSTNAVTSEKSPKKRFLEKREILLVNRSDRKLTIENSVLTPANEEDAPPRKKVCLDKSFEAGIYGDIPRQDVQPLCRNARRRLYVDLGQTCEKTTMESDEPPTKLSKSTDSEHTRSNLIQHYEQTIPCKTKQRPAMNNCQMSPQNRLSSTQHAPHLDTPRIKYLRTEIAKRDRLLRFKDLKIKRLQSSKRRLKKKNSSLTEILNELKTKSLITSDQYTSLKSSNVAVNDLLRRCEDKLSSGKSQKNKYSARLRTFALTLHFYSPKAYEYVRKTFETCLPHTRTIRKWYQSIDAKPGFTKESLNALKIKASSVNHKLVCNLVMDEMAIKKRVEWDGQEMHGYVDIGNTKNDRDYVDEAKQALVFLVVALNGAWKVPVGYYLVDGVTGEQRANLVKQCLELLHSTGIEITSLTFDGCNANISMATQLGCSLEANNLKTFFDHPVSCEPIYVFLDACHMVKLVRNALEAYRIFLDDQNQKIKWEHLQKLNEIQEKEHFHLANKLRRGHIFFKNQKMKVKLATQLFSLSVAKALTFLATFHSDFKDIEGTSKFIKIINNRFDTLNSRNINIKQYSYKKPLHEKNKNGIFMFLDKAIAFINSLKLTDGTKLVQSGRKTGFVGLLVCIESTKGLYTKLVEKEKKLKYLCSYKTSQDHLELLFGHIRAHGGCNTNPTARQFRAIYKKLLVKSELRDIQNGNCSTLEELSILTCSSAVENINRTTERNQLCETLDDDNNLQLLYEQALFDDEIDVLVNNLTEFSEQAIAYVAGFVVHALIKKIKCDTCISGLIANEMNSSHKFIKFKDNGGLIFPSNDVIQICKKMEVAVKSVIIQDNKLILYSENMKSKIINKTLRHFIGINVFKDIGFHQYDQSSMDNHLIQLTKAVMEKFTDIRLKYLTKNFTPRLSKRQVLSKYLHNINQ